MNPDKSNESKNEPNIVKTYAEITTRNQKREDIKLDTVNKTNPTNTCKLKTRGRGVGVQTRG